MSKSAVIIAPLWETGGSRNIFAAQTEYYRQRGYRVAMTLIPEFIKPKQLFNVRIRNVFDCDLNDVVAGQPQALSARYAVSKRLLRNNVKSIIHRNYVLKSGDFSVSTRQFLNDYKLHEVCINYTQHIDFGRAMSSKYAAARAAVTVHTHDIMSDFTGILLNPAEGRKVAAREPKWLSEADQIFHVSDDDFAHYRKLSSRPQAISYITLNPETERRLSRFRRDELANTVLFVGDDNISNRPSVDWFIRQVLPFVSEKIQIYFAGAICSHIESCHAARLARWPNVHCLGVVKDITKFYERCSIIMLPTMAGTGASVKFIEALATGTTVVMTKLAARGVPEEVRDAMCPYTTDDPIDFAERLNLAATLPKTSDFNAIYQKFFSNAAWFGRLDEARGAMAS